MFTFAKFCRLCSKNENYLVNYNQTDANNISYYDKIKNFLPELVDDKYKTFPQWICVICCEELNQFNMFREKCYNTHKLLSKYKEQLRSARLETTTLNENSNSLSNHNNDNFDSESKLSKDTDDTTTNNVFDDDTINTDENSRNSNISIVKNEIPLAKEEELNFNLFYETVLKSETQLNVNDNINNEISKEKEENIKKTKMAEEEISKNPKTKLTNLQKLSSRKKKRTANIFDSDTSDNEDDDFIESSVRESNIKKLKTSNTVTTPSSSDENVNLSDNEPNNSDNLTQTQTGDNNKDLSENYKTFKIYTSGNISKTILIDKSKCTKVVSPFFSKSLKTNSNPENSTNKSNSEKISSVETKITDN